MASPLGDSRFGEVHTPRPEMEPIVNLGAPAIAVRPEFLGSAFVLI